MPIPNVLRVGRDSSRHSSRLFRRSPWDLRAQLVALLDTGERVVVHARTRDLSHSGAGVTLTSDLPSGTAVVLCMRLPSGGQLCMQAVIARRQGFRAGLRFMRPTAEQRLMLSELCCA